MRSTTKFLVGAVLAFVCAQAGAVYYLMHNCSSELYDFGYVAYCNGAFAYNEQGAIYYGIERSAIESLKKADVLFLGNSRLQVAFSTKSVNKFFEKKGIRYYLLGFGYNETDLLPNAIIEKYHLRPKVVVVNADPFFLGDASFVGKQVLTGLQRDEYIYKKFAQWVHPALCNLPLGPLICNPRLTTFRSPANGAFWNPPGGGRDSGTPVFASTRPYDVGPYVKRAKALVERLGIPPQCLVLTVVPSGANPIEPGKEIATKIQSPFIGPTIDGLVTSDGSHLADSSAERWSAAFVAELEPVLSQCGVTSAR